MWNSPDKNCWILSICFSLDYFLMSTDILQRLLQDLHHRTTSRNTAGFKLKPQYLFALSTLKGASVSSSFNIYEHSFIFYIDKNFISACFCINTTFHSTTTFHCCGLFLWTWKTENTKTNRGITRLHVSDVWLSLETVFPWFLPLSLHWEINIITIFNQFYASLSY